MMKIGLIVLLSLFVVMRSTAEEMRVVGSRVNLRARPDTHAEIVGQVERGDLVVAKSMTDLWVEIVPPAGTEFWVHGDFVENNVVVGSRLNVRAGPGVNFAVVALLERGDPIEPVGEFTDWISIRPPPGASIWIAKDYVESVAPVATEGSQPEVAAEAEDMEPAALADPILPPEPTPVPPAAVAAPVVERPPPEPPTDLVLIPLAGQGEAVQVEGVLRPAGFVFGRPSRYRLTHQRGNSIETLAYVRGNQSQLQSLLGHTLRIDGHRYWVQGARHPVIVPEKMVLVSPATE